MVNVQKKLAYLALYGTHRHTKDTDRQTHTRIHNISSFKDFGIVAEEGLGRLSEPEEEDHYKEAAFSGHMTADAHMNWQRL